MKKQDGFLRGRSIAAFPESYCVVDLETTGLRPETDHIIEIGAIRYAGGKEIGWFDSLVQPPITAWGTYVDPYIAALTGISNDMLAAAPPIQETIRQFAQFLGSDIIVGYNVGFDVGFLHRAFADQLGKSLQNDYVDALRFARKLYPEMHHHRLSDMADRFGIVNEHAHRALSDVEATAACFERMHADVLARYSSEEEFLIGLRGGRTRGNMSVSVLSESSGTDALSGSLKRRASDFVGNPELEQPNSPFYRRTITFTGKLMRYTHQEAMQVIADLGGINEDQVNRFTCYLVVGGSNSHGTGTETKISGPKSAKHRKAEELNQNGGSIRIISEAEFYEMLDGQQGLSDI